MKKYLILIVITFIFNTLQSQGETCLNLTASPSAYQNFSNSISLRTPLEIKIYFHIYTDGNGMGNLDENQIATLVDLLNDDYFHNTDISFNYNTCEIRYIDNNSLYNSGDRCDFFNTEFRHSDGLDIQVFY